MRLRCGCERSSAVASSRNSPAPSPRRALPALESICIVEACSPNYDPIDYN
ncbi:MAG TPA: hypothetical protein VLI71_13440 [Gammaproteobacteria bacterium]|nr:hypothetical protein [Gammaproteobacteria bacterium]